MTVCTVAIDSIVVPEVRSNAIYNEEQWKGFVESVKASGIQYRPCCRSLPDGRVELVDGLHRMLAWKELGHTDIDVELEILDDMQAMTKHLTANHHRGEADPVGLGRVVKRMHEAGKSYEDIGKVLGYSANTVSKYEGLLVLPDFVLDALTKQRIKIGHVQQFARLEDMNDVQAAMQFSIEQGWTVQQLSYWTDARIMERKTAYATPDAVMGNAITPPPPSVDLVQQRQCLCCGSYDKAENTVMWQMCGNCANTLRYLKELQKFPWDGLQYIVQAMQQAQAEVAEKDKRIKELEAEIVQYSRRILNAPAAAIPAWPKPASTGSDGSQLQPR